ncbi:hypothetical protein [Bacillus sp. EAC]|uniref:hypothetical protein n=1 Tax=Bacillus sp. EAC TaxID=1978338 RepID=UPI00211AF636|nr:hypothetical protein [Bacillus sp. EAC]
MTKSTVQDQLLTQSELGKYLGLSKIEILKLTELRDGENSYTSELPHIKIDLSMIIQSQRSINGC